MKALVGNFKAQDLGFKLSQERRASHRQHHHRAVQAAVQHSVSAGIAEEDCVILYSPDTCCSFSCGIELEDRVVVSGGYEFLDLTSQVCLVVIYTYNIFRYTSSYISTHYLRQVWVYSLTGLVEELPNMIEKRFTHGCGHYVNTDNEEVSP